MTGAGGPGFLVLSQAGRQLRNTGVQRAVSTPDRKRWHHNRSASRHPGKALRNANGKILKRELRVQIKDISYE